MSLKSPPRLLLLELEGERMCRALRRESATLPTAESEEVRRRWPGAKEAESLLVVLVMEGVKLESEPAESLLPFFLWKARGKKAPAPSSLLFIAASVPLLPKLSDFAYWAAPCGNEVGGTVEVVDDLGFRFPILMLLSQREELGLGGSAAGGGSGKVWKSAM